MNLFYLETSLDGHDGNSLDDGSSRTPSDVKGLTIQSHNTEEFTM